MKNYLRELQTIARGISGCLSRESALFIIDRIPPILVLQLIFLLGERGLCAAVPIAGSPENERTPAEVSTTGSSSVCPAPKVWSGTSCTCPAPLVETGAGGCGTEAPVCEYSFLDARWVLDDLQNNFDLRGGDPGIPGCISSKMETAHTECSELSTAGNFNEFQVDDCVAWKVFGAYQVPDWGAAGNAVVNYYGANLSTTFGGVTDEALSSAINTYLLAVFGSPAFYGNQYNWAPYSLRSRSTIDLPFYTSTIPLTVDLEDRIYIQRNADGSCSPSAAPSSGVAACYAGIFYWYASPISLLIDENTDIDKNLEIVQFPLDVRKDSAQWSIWKASGKAPLLVYDPEHTGKIISATQLFGDWTFGGREDVKLGRMREAKLDDGKQSARTLTDLPAQATPWSDGYEALAILDLNFDGKLSGEELTPIALWFDANRNGISEAGEVKRLNSAGITALYYKANRLDKRTNNLYADKGFERIVNGRTVMGRSVDWNSDTAASKAELINRYLAKSLGCAATFNGGETMKASDQPAGTSLKPVMCPQIRLGMSSDAPSLAKKSGVSNLSGLWKWSSSDIPGRAEGYFGFSDLDDGVLRGRVYSSFGVKDRSVGFSTIFSAIRFEGIKGKKEKDAVQISFTLRPDDTSLIKNQAVYDPKADTLTGQSVAQVSFESKPVDLKYSWVATRVQLASVFQASCQRPVIAISHNRL